MLPKLTSPNLGAASELDEAQLTEPKLKYREEVERHSIHGEISPAGRILLNTLHSRLGLTLREATDIEGQVLQLSQQRLERLQRYQVAFFAEIQREYPLNQETLVLLEKLQKVLSRRL